MELGGNDLKRLFFAGAHALCQNREEINELNVFPVPDGDTGTNMTLTIRSAVEEVESISKVNMVSFSKAIKGQNQSKIKMAQTTAKTKSRYLSVGFLNSVNARKKQI